MTDPESLEAKSVIDITVQQYHSWSLRELEEMIQHQEEVHPMPKLAVIPIESWTPGTPNAKRAFHGYLAFYRPLHDSETAARNEFVLLQAHCFSSVSDGGGNIDDSSWRDLLREAVLHRLILESGFRVARRLLESVTTSLEYVWLLLSDMRMFIIGR